MNKIILILLSLIFLITSINAIPTNNLSVNFNIEEGFGGFIFDSQNNLGVGVADIPKNTYWAVNSQFDTYSIYPKPTKNINILISDYLQLNPLTPFTLETTFKPTNTLGIETLFDKLNEYSITLDGVTQTATLSFNNGVVNNILIPNITYGQFNKIFLVWNGTSYNTYLNNISISQIPSLLPLVSNINPLNLMGGTYSGSIDNFRIYNYGFNANEINNLFNYNEIFNPNNIVTSPAISNEIINSTNIVLMSDNSVNLNLNLNSYATCQLYVDNSLITTFSNQISYSYNYNEIGTHDYFYYCEKIEQNSLKLFELTQKQIFNITKLSKTIDFTILDSNNNLLSAYDDLYLVTTCFNDNEMSKYNIPKKPRYIQKLVNGQANFNLSFDSEYEFCLLKGKVNFKDDFFSLNYNLPDVTKQTELGILFVNNETLSYSLKVDDTDLFGVIQPEFWGQSWNALFQLIVGVLLGGLIIFLGMVAGNDKLMLVGGLIIAIGMGVGLTTFVGVLV